MNEQNICDVIMSCWIQHQEVLESLGPAPLDDGSIRWNTLMRSAVFVLKLFKPLTIT